jgi:hypothetical protein
LPLSVENTTKWSCDDYLTKTRQWHWQHSPRFEICFGQSNRSSIRGGSFPLYGIRGHYQWTARLAPGVVIVIRCATRIFLRGGRGSEKERRSLQRDVVGVSGQDFLHFEQQMLKSARGPWKDMIFACQHVGV